MRFVCLLVVSGVLCHADIVMSADPFLVGYAENWSNVSGEAADFYLSSEDNPNGTLTVYDVLSTPVATLNVPLKRQTVASDNPIPWETGYGWEPTTLDLPALPSGLYYLNGPKVGGDYVPFIVTEPEKEAEIVVIYPTNTVNAYSLSPNVNNNPNFGNEVSLYTRGEDGRYVPNVSFHRPQNNKVYWSAGFDRWVLNEQRGNFKYISDSDLESYDSISGAKMVVIPTHSEYWTAEARRNFDRFVDDGGSALVLSGNTMFRSVGYDDAESPTVLEFSPRLQFTQASLEYPTWESIGVDFLNAGYTAAFGSARERIDMPYDGMKMLDVSPSYFAGTGVKEGDILSDSISKEYDGVPFVSLDPVTGPVIDREIIDFHRLDIIGFENTYIEGRNTAGTWVDFQKTPDSGRVINTGASGWVTFVGKDGENRRRITSNMVDLLLIEQADFDGNEMLTANDIDLLYQEVANPDATRRYDLTSDGLVDDDDVERWLSRYADTSYGDANLDGDVDFGDFLVVGTGFGKKGGWGDGDFNGNGIVDFHDFLFFQVNFGRVETAASVPEPLVQPIWLCVLVGLALRSVRHRRCV